MLKTGGYRDYQRVVILVTKHVKMRPLSKANIIYKNNLSLKFLTSISIGIHSGNEDLSARITLYKILSSFLNFKGAILGTASIWFTSLISIAVAYRPCPDLFVVNFSLQVDSK